MSGFAGIQPVRKTICPSYSLKAKNLHWPHGFGYVRYVWICWICYVHECHWMPLIKQGKRGVSNVIPKFYLASISFASSELFCTLPMRPNACRTSWIQNATGSRIIESAAHKCTAVNLDTVLSQASQSRIGYWCQVLQSESNKKPLVQA